MLRTMIDETPMSRAEAAVLPWLLRQRMYSRSTAGSLKSRVKGMHRVTKALESACQFRFGSRLNVPPAMWPRPGARAGGVDGDAEEDMPAGGWWERAKKKQKCRVPQWGACAKDRLCLALGVEPLRVCQRGTSRSHSKRIG